MSSRTQDAILVGRRVFFIFPRDILSTILSSLLSSLLSAPLRSSPLLPSLPLLQCRYTLSLSHNPHISIISHHTIHSSALHSTPPHSTPLQSTSYHIQTMYCITSHTHQSSLQLLRCDTRSVVPLTDPCPWALLSCPVLCIAQYTIGYRPLGRTQGWLSGQGCLHRSTLSSLVCNDATSEPSLHAEGGSCRSLPFQTSTPLGERMGPSMPSSRRSFNFQPLTSYLPPREHSAPTELASMGWRGGRSIHISCAARTCKCFPFATTVEMELDLSRIRASLQT